MTIPRTSPLPLLGVSPGRILVIDDSDLMLQRIGSALTQAGFDVVTTNQTVGAARHLRSCDLVIVDFHMPGLDGATVLTSLKSAAQSSNAQCMFLLYTSDEAMAKRYAEHGFDGALAKKGNIPELVPQVHALLRIVRMRALKQRK